MSGSGWPAYAGWMLLAGIGIPVLAALNAGLGGRVGSAPAASVIALTLALSCAVAVTLATGAWPRGAAWGDVPTHFFVGGVFMAFYLLSITFVGPRFGIGNAVFFVLLGQIASAAAIDHFGLFGAERAAIGGWRIAGIALMALGVFLARKPVA